MIAGVPYDAEIEYLESTGYQFIATEYCPNSLSRIEIDMAFPTDSELSYSGRFGNRSRWTFGVEKGDTSTQGKYSFAQGGFYGIIVPNGDRAQFHHLVNDIAKHIVSVDEVVKQCTVVSNWYPNDYPAILFASNVIPISGTNINGYELDINSIGRSRIARCIISENGTAIRNFIPVRVGSVGYMYDRVTRKLFGNKGTGAFILGPDVATPVMGLRRYPQIGGAA